MVEVMKKVSGDYVENAKMAKKNWKDAVVLDVTMGGGMEKLDPSFPIGKVRIPGIKRKMALSIGGMWEGLKIFKKKDVIDESFFVSEKKLGKKRCCKGYGELVGVKIGDEVVDVEKGIEEVFVKRYKEEMKERFEMVIEGLKNESKKRTVVLLDYREGEEKYPVSHVELLKEIIEEK